MTYLVSTETRDSYYHLSIWHQNKNVIGRIQSETVDELITEQRSEIRHCCAESADVQGSECTSWVLSSVNILNDAHDKG